MSIQSKSQTQCFIELDNVLWKVPVSDYSFSQSVDTQDIVRNEMAVDESGYINRGISIENTRLNVADWSVTVPMRPTKSTGSGTGRSSLTTGHHHPVEEPLWAMLSAGDPVAVQYPTQNLADLPGYRRATWTLDLVSTNLGGNCTTCGTNGTDLWYSGTKEHRIDLYIFPKLMSFYQNYAEDFDWTMSTSGSVYTEALGGVPLGYTRDLSSEQYANYRDTINPNKPVFFVYSKQGMATYGGTDHDPQPGKSYFLLSLMLPSDKTLGEFISAYGNITLAATARNAVAVEGVNSSQLASTWEFNLASSNHEELADANIYFVTDKPVATIPAGTINSKNTLIAEENRHWESIRYNLHHQDSSQYYTQKGNVGLIALNSQHHGNSVAGLNTPWTVQGFRTRDANNNPQYSREYYIYPDKVTRLGVDYSINKTTGTWIDGDGDSYPAPTLRFRSENPPYLHNSISVSGAKKYSYFGTDNKHTNQSAGFRRGDLLTVLAGTLDDNGVPLDVDVSFIVTAVGANEGYSYDTKIYGLIGDQFPLFGDGDPAFIQNNFYIEGEDLSTGIKRTYTKHSASGQALRRVVTQAINGSAVSGGTATLAAANSNIRVGAQVTSPGLEIRHPVYVASISGTTLKFSGSVVLPANTVLTFTDYEDNAGLSNGEYRWYHDGNKNILIIREHTEALAAGIQGDDPLRVYLSESRNSGGSSVVKLQYAALSTCSIDFDMDSVAQIQWSGVAGNLLQQAPNFTIASSAPSAPVAGDIFYDIDDDTVFIRDPNNTAWRDCITEGAESSTNFIRNKLTTVGVNTNKTNASNTINLPEVNDFPFTIGTPLNTLNGYEGLASSAGHSHNTAGRQFDIFDRFATELAGVHSWYGSPARPNGQVQMFALNKYAEVFVVIDGVTLPVAMYSDVPLNPTGIAITEDTPAALYRHDNNNTRLVLSDKTLTKKYSTLAAWNAAIITMYLIPKVTIEAIETTVHPIGTFDIPILSGNITIENNLQVIYNNRLGTLDQPIAAPVGARSIKGSLTAYLEDNTSALLDNIKSYQYNTTDSSRLSFEGDVTDQNKDFITPLLSNLDINLGGLRGEGNTVSFIMENVHLKTPTHNIDDILTTTIDFSAHSSFLTKQASSDTRSTPIGPANELVVQYKGS
jgi:hypothetical protein